VLGLWSWQAPGWGWRQALGWVLLLACAGAALQAWRVAPTGWLAWDGERWSWHGDDGGGSGRLEKVLDVQARMLLRWHPEGGPSAWLWVERMAAPADWNALRRAVYSPARTEAPQGMEPPRAGP
jgi:toxin CptA